MARPRGQLRQSCPVWAAWDPAAEPQPLLSLVVAGAAGGGHHLEQRTRDRAIRKVALSCFLKSFVTSMSYRFGTPFKKTERERCVHCRCPGAGAGGRAHLPCGCLAPGPAPRCLPLSGVVVALGENHCFTCKLMSHPGHLSLVA